MIPNNPKLEDLLIRKKTERKFKQYVFIELRKQNRQKGKGIQCQHHLDLF